MTAAVLYGKEDLKIEKVPIPRVEDGEVLIKVEVALTCGTDLKVYQRGYHARMITALINLQIGSTSESHLNLDEHLTIFHTWNRHFFNLQVLLTVEDCGCHFSVHSSIALPYLYKSQ